MIRTVKEFYLGQLVYYEKRKYRITKFPTRSSVILTHTRKSGACVIKTTIRDLRQKAFLGKQDIEG
jgi:hypothetical protein